MDAYRLRQYSLEQGALEIQYIEEYFLDFPRKKTEAEVAEGRITPAVAAEQIAEMLK